MLVGLSPLIHLKPTRAVSGRSGPMRAGFPTGTHRCRSYEEAHPLLGWRACACHERRMLLQNSNYLWSIFWASSFVNSNTWHLICNSFNLNFIYGIVCLYVCVFVHSHFIENPPIWSWETNPSFLRWFCHNFPVDLIPWNTLGWRLQFISVRLQIILWLRNANTYAGAGKTLSG
jgi:hypothetical protein